MVPTVKERVGVTMGGSAFLPLGPVTVQQDL